jgi:3'-phosphoadenosine 5'-phosphosulfate (PAPS) 3'-phosphatase
MIQQTVTLPDKDYQLFLELVKHFSWEVDNQPVTKSDESILLGKNIIAMLEKRAKTPNHLCLSEEESNLRLNEL